MTDEPQRLNDEAARMTAMSEFTRNVLVIAGAGTGKTMLLIGRMLHWLLGEFWTAKLDPRYQQNPALGAVRSIAAITFTEKAAGEMAERLSHYLITMLQPETLREQPLLHSLMLGIRTRYGLTETELRQRTEAVSALVEWIEINTIHGFCAGILREHADLSKVSPEFTIDAGERLKKLIFQQQWERFVRVQLDREVCDDSWRVLLNQGSLVEYQDFIMNLAEANVIPEEHDESFVRRLLGDPESMIAELITNLGQLMPSLEIIVSLSKALKKAAQAWERVVQPLHRALLDSEPMTALGAMAGVPEVSRLLSEAGELANCFVSNKTVSKRFDSEQLAALRVLLDKVQARAWYVMRYRGNERFWLALVETLGDFIQTVRHEWRRQGAVSFHDLLTLTHDVLRDSEPRRELLKRRYRQLLVDELQDTDPVQSVIVTYLCETEGAFSPSVGAVKLAEGKLFVVGDPKQSIYGFRNADLRAYEWLAHFMQQQGAVTLHLTTNFRSTPQVLEGVNQVFAQSMIETSELQPPYIAIAPRPQADEGPLVELWIPVSSDRGDLAWAIKADDAAAIEARAIAATISREVAGGEQRCRDYAILLRAMPPAPMYMDALEAAGVPFVVQGDKDFYKRQEVLDCINLITCLLNPLDAPAFAGWLRSPLVGLPETAFVTVIDAGVHHRWWREDLDRCLDRIAPELRSQWWGGFVNALKALRLLYDQFGVLPGHQWVETVMQCFPLPEVYGLRYLGDRRAANVRKFFNELRRAIGDDHDRIQNWLRDQTTAHLEIREEGEGVLADESIDAVRIMTIHQAKGLEFPVVFLANQHRQRAAARGVNAGITRLWKADGDEVALKFGDCETINFHAHQMRDELREEAESVRTSYVAYTRARRRLILTGAVANQWGTLKTDDESAIRFIMPFVSVCCGSPPRPAADGYPATASEGAEPRWLRIRLLPEDRWPEPESAPRAGASFEGIDFGQYEEIWRGRAEVYRELLGREPIVNPSALHDSDRDEPISDELEEGAAASVTAQAGSVPSSDLVGGEDEGRAGRLIGTLCHRIMELLDFSAPQSSMAATISDERQEMAAKAGSPELGERIVAEAQRILLGFFGADAFFHLRASRILGREVPFIMHEDGSSAVAPRAVFGVIDVVYQDDGGIVIADYKSDRISSREHLEQKKQTYAQQCRCYARALQEALKLPALPPFELLFLRTGDRLRIEPSAS